MSLGPGRLAFPILANVYHFLAWAQDQRAGSVCSSSWSAAANLVRHFAKCFVIRTFGNPERAGTKSFGVVSRSKLTVVHKHQLVKDEVRHAFQLRHEKRVDEHRKTALGALAFRHGMREFACAQLTGVKNNFAWVADASAVFEDQAQFFPADARAVLREDVLTFRGEVRVTLVTPAEDSNS